MARRLESRTLAGRSEELARLEEALDGAAAGSPGAVLLGGEAGMGKTRLLRELSVRAERRGALVLTGQCVGLEAAAIPLLPIADALSRASGGDDAPWTTLTGTAASAPERLFAAIDERLRRLSAAKPLVLIVEDAHWADRSTLDLLTFLLRRLAGERMLIALTYRSDELGRRDDLRAFLADVTRVSIVERFELPPLTRAEARAQLEGIVGPQPDRRWADAVCARAEGNPLFLEELAALPSDAGAGELPLRLRDMLLARLGRLSPAAQEVVRTAAAGGRRVQHALLAGAVELPERRLAAALREAVQHHVLVAGDDGYAFRHALLQEAAYGELLPGERARLHATFAHALERVGGHAAELAHHWQRAGDKARALQAAVRAGAEAERLHAPAEAADHFTRALELWPAVPEARGLAGTDRTALLERAAVAASGSGRHALALELLESAIALVDAATEPVRAGLLHARRGWEMWYDGRGTDADPAYEQAARLVPHEPPSAARARVLASWGLMLLLTGRPGAARERCEEAIAVARAVGARAEEAEALHALGAALDSLGDRAAGIAHLRRARALAREAGAPEIEARAAINLSHSLRRHGRLEEAHDVGLEGAEVSRRAGLDFTSGGYCLCNAAEAALDLGRWEEADRITRELLDRGMNNLAALHLRAALELARGDVEAAAGYEGLLTDSTPEFGAERATLEAGVALSCGRPGDAARRAAAGARAIESVDPLVHAELVALAVRAEADVAAVARARRDAPAAERAAASARALRDAARAHASAAAQPALAATIEAELERAENRGSAESWEAAARAWEARSTPYRAAYARWRQAEALLAAKGGRAAATAVLREAHAIARQLGARPLAAEIEALARRARIELAEPVAPAPAAHADHLGLTPREREVLDHLALGQTNRQIAEDLFISVKTAGVHVSHILEKLDVSTRGEAAAAARRLGLVA